MSSKATSFYMSEPVDIHIYTETRDGSERIEIEGIELFDSEYMSHPDQAHLRGKLEGIVSALEDKGLGGLEAVWSGPFSVSPPDSETETLEVDFNLKGLGHETT